MDDAVRLSHRYIAGRQLPDKAVSLLDTACARVAHGPERRRRRRIEDCAARSSSSTCADRDPRARSRRRRRSRRIAELDELQGRGAKARGASWTKLEGSAGTKRTRSSSRKIREHARPPGRRTEPRKTRGGRPRPHPTPHAGSHAPRRKAQAARGAGRAASRSCDELQGENAAGAARASIRQAVAEVVSGWTGIPVGKMVTDEIRTVLDAARTGWKSAIIGQIARAGGDRRSASARRGPTWPIRAGRSASSCWSAPAASARPRRRWRSPTCSTAASGT